MTGSSLCVIVTGGGGFVGSHLFAALDAALGPDDELVITTSRPVGEFVDGGLMATGRREVRRIAMDITDAARVGAVIRQVMPTHVVHLAAVSAVVAGFRNPRLAWAVNHGGTLNLALSVAEHCPDCHIVFSSSAEVYGASFKAGVPLDETALLQPANPYAVSKAAADLLLGQMAMQGLRAVRLRPFNHTGPGQSEDFAIPSFAAQIARIERGIQEPVIRVGALDSMRDFLDVADVVDAYVRTIRSADALPAGAVMNLSSGKALRIGDMLETLLSLSRAEIRVETDPARLRPSDTPVVIGDSARAADLLGWKPAREISGTLAAVLDYWRTRTAG